MTTIILPALAAAFAACCVWLTVRIVNRRERWAKWTLAAMVALPVLYVASFGPAIWATSRNLASRSFVERAYGPVLWSMVYGPRQITRSLMWWGELCIRDTTSFRVDSNYGMVFESQFDRS